MPTLETERLILRIGQPDDIPAILKFIKENIDHLQKWEPRRPPSFQTEEFWLKQVQTNIDEFVSDKSLRFFLFPKEDLSCVIGNVNFSNFVRGAAHMCHLGYAIAAKYEGKGLMSEAVLAAINYAFDELNMHRVMANYIPDNVRSANLLNRLGFTIEGTAKEYLLIDGKWRDHILTSLVNKNWKQP